MIEIKHKGPVMVVPAGELASITMGGKWHILASYQAQVREYIPQRWNYDTNSNVPGHEEVTQRQMFVVGQSIEEALADLRSKYKKLRAEVGEARARELLGE